MALDRNVQQAEVKRSLVDDLSKSFLDQNEDIEGLAEFLEEELGYSSTATYPSTPSTFIDLPEITSVTSEFFYNYYTRDERTISTGESTVVDITSPDQDIEFVKKRNEMPRSVILKIRSRPSGLSDSAFAKSFGKDNGKDLLKNSVDKIVLEGAVANKRFSHITLRDNQVDDTFYKQLSGSISFDDSYSKSDTSSQLFNDLSTKFFSPMASATQTASTLQKALSNVQPNGVRYAPTDARIEVIAEALRDVRFVEFGLTANHAVISNLVLGSLEDRGNIFQDELLGIEEVTKQMQADYVAASNPSSISSSEYELEMASVYSISKEQARARNSVVGTDLDEASYPIGYYIEKTEMQSDGEGGLEAKSHNPLIIDSYGDFNIFDSDIKYGATYIYNVKIIYVTTYEAMAIDPDGTTPNESIFAVSMVASEGVKTQVAALEAIPPTPPQNLSFKYNFSERGLGIFWEEPRNPQRDVVRYQIFRRESVHESFTLLAEYDFDHSTSKVVPLEEAPEDSLFKVSGPSKYYLDEKFDKSRSYIYTLAAVDARGLTSEYSEQVQVTFDKYKNTISRNRVSRSGAPKSYPNLYLRTDLFVDSIQSSGATRMRVFFDPEYYDLVRTTIEPQRGSQPARKVDASLKLISDKYKIQMINLDYQNSQVFDISISDETGYPIEIPLSSATIKSIF